VADYPRPLARLVREFSRLPGVGPRSAERLAFHLLSRSKAKATSLAAALDEAIAALDTCPDCQGLSLGGVCEICSDPARDPQLVCVVEEAREVFTLEQSKVFSGRYHVLGGVISPLEGIGPDELAIDSLMTRIESGAVRELILATDLDPEGEATAAYLLQRCVSSPVIVSRLAMGLPSGAQIGYSDPTTLAGAFTSRRLVRSPAR